MADAGRLWAPPRWNSYRGKHRAKRGTPWKKVVKGTSAYPAKYRLDMTDAEQQALELRCLQDGTLIGEDGSVRSYYLNAGTLVGASNGEETNYVYAEHLRAGDVHGSPITETELRRLGVQI